MFGPISRTPYSRPIAWISFWPSTLPVSAKPEGMRTAPGIFFSPHLAQHARHELRRDREDGDVDHARHVLDAAIGAAPEDLVGARMDRIDLAAIAAVDEVLHHRVADLAVLARGADDGDGVRPHDPPHGAEDVVAARARRRRRRIEVEHDAHVGRDRALGRGEDRVQIHLGDLGEVGDQLADVLNELRERLAVDAFLAAHALEDGGGGDAVEHRHGIRPAGRREAEGHVLQSPRPARRPCRRRRACRSSDR